MKKWLISVAGVLLLLLWVDAVLAQGGGGGRDNRVLPAPPPGRRMQAESPDPNNELSKTGQTGDVQTERERLREAARQRMRDRIAQRGGDPNLLDAVEPNLLRRGRPRPARTETFEDGEPNRTPRADRPADRQQQLKAVLEQVERDEDKHLERAARLKRIRDLAEQQGDAKTVERVDKLIQQEQQRYDIKKQRMESRRERIMEFARRSADANAPSARPQRLEKAAEAPQEPNKQ